MTQVTLLFGNSPEIAGVRKAGAVNHRSPGFPKRPLRAASDMLAKGSMADGFIERRALDLYLWGQRQGANPGDKRHFQAARSETVGDINPAGGDFRDKKIPFPSGEVTKTARAAKLLCRSGGVCLRERASGPTMGGP